MIWFFKRCRSVRTFEFYYINCRLRHIKPFYAIYSDVVSLFVDLFFLVFNIIEYVMILSNMSNLL
jgi:hypothetical protein